VKACRAGDRRLQLLVLNEEFLVSASHQLALITSLPFVHTAHRYYRLDGLVRRAVVADTLVSAATARQTWSSRGSKSCNKVSVGEPAEGSLAVGLITLCGRCLWTMMDTDIDDSVDCVCRSIAYYF
jgi:hypothetical protein